MKIKLMETLVILLFSWLALIPQGCSQEVKPLLKPAEPDLAARIATQQKRIDQESAARIVPYDKLRTLQENLNRINERYSRSKAAGGPDAREAEEISRLLNENSERIFEATQGTGKKMIK